MAQPAPQTQVVVPTKSMGIALILSILFGPLGMLYSTVPGAVVMFIINLVVGIFTAGFGLLITWPIGIIWAALAVKGHNESLMAGRKRA